MTTAAPTAPAPKAAPAKAQVIPAAATAKAAPEATAPKPAPTHADIESAVSASLAKVQKAQRDARAAAVRVYRALGLKLADGAELALAEAEALAEAMRVLGISGDALAADVLAVGSHRLQTRYAADARVKVEALELRSKEWGAELEALDKRRLEINAEKGQFNGALMSLGSHQNEADRLATAHVLLLGTEEQAVAKVCEPPRVPKIIRSGGEMPQMPAHIPDVGLMLVRSPFAPTLRPGRRMYLTNDAVLATGPALPSAEERKRAELLAEWRAIYAELARKWREEMMPALRRAMKAHLAALLECARAGRIAEHFTDVPGFPQVPPTLVCSAEQLDELARGAIGAGLVDAGDPVVSEIDEFLKSAEG